MRGIDGPVVAVATSRDNSRAAALSTSGQVVVWQLADRLRLGAFHTSATGNYGELHFVDPNTLVVSNGHRLESFGTVDGGATWTQAWKWPPRRSTRIDRFAASPYGIVVAHSDRVELLDAFGNMHQSVLAPGLASNAYGTKIVFSPSGTYFAAAGSVPCVDLQP